MGGLGLEDGLLRDMQWLETDLRIVSAEYKSKSLNAESCIVAFGMNILIDVELMLSKGRWKKK